MQQVPVGGTTIIESYQGQPSLSPSPSSPQSVRPSPDRKEGLQMVVGTEEREYNLEGQQFEHERRPIFFRKIPSLFRYDHYPVEATGVAMSSWTRGILFMASVYFGPALLALAADEAAMRCESDDDLDQDCAEHVRLYGFKASSVLSNVTMFAGIFSALALPICGAIVDHTPHRRTVGIVCATIMAVIKVAESGVSARNWFFMSCLQVVSYVSYHLLTVTECKSRCRTLIRSSSSKASNDLFSNLNVFRGGFH